MDWDDTLCPTWWASRASGVETTSISEDILAHSEELGRHAEVVEQLLRAAREVARVAIVTLATPEWVAASVRRLFPGVDIESVFVELGIPIYYAVVAKGPRRDSSDPRIAAKKKAMVRSLQYFYGYAPMGGPRWNVLSIGDSAVEQAALKELLKDNSRSPLCKTVKLAGEPTLQQMTSQLESLLPQLRRMVAMDKDFDRTGSALLRPS